MQPTKTQRLRAVTILGELWRAECPDWLTSNDAAAICETYGVSDHEFNDNRHPALQDACINISRLALEIAMNEGAR